MKLARLFKRCAMVLSLSMAFGAYAADDITVSSELLAPLQEVQQLFKDKQYVQALDKLAVLEKIKVPSAEERLLIERLRSVSALYANQLDVASASYAAMIASPKLDAKELPTLFEVKAGIDFRRKAFKDAVVAAKSYFDKGGNKASIRLVWAQAAYFAGDFKDAADQAGVLVNAFVSRAAMPEKSIVELLASSQQGLKNEAGYLRALELLVQYYPTPEYWEDLLGRLQSDKAYADYSYDIYRLQLATGSMTLPDAIDMAQSAIKQGFPAEAVSAIRSAESDKRASDADRNNARRLLADANAALKQDSSAGGAKKGKVASDANALFNEGYNQYLLGQTSEGVAAMRRAVDAGGLKRPESGKLRLASIYLQLNKPDDARMVVSGLPEGSPASVLFKLWMLAKKA